MMEFIWWTFAIGTAAAAAGAILFVVGIALGMGDIK